MERHLAHVLARPELPPALVDAMRYATLGPGKRIRPVLAWQACVAAGGNGPECLPVAAAVELVHAFSLVHDDLPALDNDDLRRGRPTLHRQAGEAMAILAGDALLTIALAPLLDAPFTSERRVELLRALVNATSGMIAGQVYDTLGGLPGGLSPEERVVLIHSNKTGALIRASCVMGAKCAPDPSPTVLEAIGRYAEAVGLMFQIVDDVLDVTQTAEVTGKRTGKDAAAGKTTYPGVLGVQGSQDRIESLLAEALSALEPAMPAAEPLARTARDLAARQR